MATTTTNITSTTTTQIATLNQVSPLQNNGIDIHTSGTFGGTAVTFQYSLDGGSTLINIKDSIGGSDVSISAAEGFKFLPELATGGDPILLYAVTTGGSGIDININVIDRNIG